jgi:hypothetical protein
VQRRNEFEDFDFNSWTQRHYAQWWHPGRLANLVGNMGIMRWMRDMGFGSGKKGHRARDRTPHSMRPLDELVSSGAMLAGHAFVAASSIRRVNSAAVTGETDGKACRRSQIVSTEPWNRKNGAWKLKDDEKNLH